MNKALALLVCLMLAACDGPYVPSKERNEARMQVFRECMELAAKMPRQSDDDVHKIVDACSDRAYSMTSHIK